MLFCQCACLISQIQWWTTFHSCLSNFWLLLLGAIISFLLYDCAVARTALIMGKSHWHQARRGKEQVRSGRQGWESHPESKMEGPRSSDQTQPTLKLFALPVFFKGHLFVMVEWDFPSTAPHLTGGTVSGGPELQEEGQNSQVVCSVPWTTFLLGLLSLFKLPITTSESKGISCVSRKLTMWSRENLNRFWNSCFKRKHVLNEVDCWFVG